jgi:hypothetical protein
VIPVDERIQTREQGDMNLKRYTIQTGRRGEHITTVKLTEAEAKRVGARPIDAEQKATKPAANKARTPRNKAAKPATSKTAAKPSMPASTKPAANIEDASDPDASE